MESPELGVAVPSSKEPIDVSRWAAAHPLLGALALTALSILTQGYFFGVINHGLQIPLIRTFAGVHSFDQDPFIQDLLRTYTSAFYPALGFLHRFIPLEPLFFGGFALLRFGTIWAARRLALALFDDEKTAFWTAVLVSVQTMTFAEDIVSDTYLTHGALAQLLVLLCLTELAKDRIARAFAWGGLLFAVHGMHATHLLPLLGLAAWLRPVPGRSASLASVFMKSLTALVGIVPTLVWMVKSGVLGGQVPTGYLDTVFSWFPTHFLPSTWSVSVWLMFLFPAVWTWPVSKLAAPAKDGGRVGLIAVAALVLGFGSGLLTEIFPSPFLVRLHPMRLSFIMALAGAPYFADVGRRLLSTLSDETLERPRFFGPLGGALFMGLALPMSIRSAYYLILAPWIFAAAGRLSTRAALGASSALAVVIPFAVLWDARRILSGFDGLQRVARGGTFLAAFLSVVALAMLAKAHLEKRAASRPRPRRRLGLVMLAAASIPLALHMLNQHRVKEHGALAQWLDVQRWAAQNLPAGAPILVPLGQIGFRSLSEQTPAFDFQEGDALLHDPMYTARFEEKLALYRVQREPVHGFSFWTKLERVDRELTAERASEIGRQLGARFAVRRSSHQAWKRRELYRNAGYVVLDLDTPGS